MDEMLTITECVPITRFSYTKLYKMARAGTIPFKQFGSTWLIPKSKLYEYLGMKDPLQSKKD